MLLIKKKFSLNNTNINYKKTFEPKLNAAIKISKMRLLNLINVKNTYITEINKMNHFT